MGNWNIPKKECEEVVRNITGAVKWRLLPPRSVDDTDPCIEVHRNDGTIVRVMWVTQRERDAIKDMKERKNDALSNS